MKIWNEFNQKSIAIWYREQRVNSLLSIQGKINDIAIAFKKWMAEKFIKNMLW